MLITFLLILSASLAPLPLTASPVGLQHAVECLRMPSAPPATIIDCTKLLRLLGRIPRSHYGRTFTAEDHINLGLASCTFQLQGLNPTSGVSESIRLIDYFPALQQISNQCLETPEGYNGGKTSIGNHFVASIGADGLLISAGNATVVRGAVNNASGTQTGVATA